MNIDSSNIIQPINPEDILPENFETNNFDF